MASAAAKKKNSDIEAALNTLWKHAAKDKRWRAPTPRERRVVRDAMSYLFNASAIAACTEASLHEAQRRLRKVKMTVSELHYKKTRVRVVHESDGAYRGSGLFALRCGGARPWLIQAPHTRWEANTRQIALKLFVESNARAVFWNTFFRYGAVKNEKPSDVVHAADVAHQPGTLFHAATVGALIGDPSLHVVQIHGADLKGHNVDAIVSYGTKTVRAEALRDALGKTIGRVAAFGVDVDELGGTTNVQGVVARRFGARRFLHIELSLAVRRKLVTQQDRRRQLISTLATKW